jgi:penicillin-binding protein 1A
MTAKVKANFKKHILRFWLLYVSSLAIVALFFFFISLGWLGYMPSLEELENPRSSLASEIYSADQQLLGKFYIENRSNIHYSELSPNLINALIATEDIRFEKHSGVDFRAFFRVFYGVMTGDNKGGGSTITQQLAKNLFPRKNNPGFITTALSKFKEWVVAIKLERNYTKEEILAMYFNTVDFGNMAFGIKSASMTYFDKEPKDLNIEESAMLVGMLKAPSWYNPIHNTARAMKRREVVLYQMYHYNFITKDQYDGLKNKPMDLRHFQVQDHTNGLAPYFREYLRMIMSANKPNKDEYGDPEQFRQDSIEWISNELYGWLNKNPKPNGSQYNLYRDGLKIYTTLNSKMQKYAEEAVTEHLSNEIQPAFFNHWKGVKNAPFAFPNENATDEVERIIASAIKRTDRYRLLKEANASDSEIFQVFNTKIQMRVFSWKGDKDTIMSPRDSILYYKYYLQSGLMSVEPQTGFVRAYVGGINYKHFQYDHVKLLRRQVGSTFKPFVYTLAMQEGSYNPCSMVPNTNQVITLPSGQTWSPSNSSDYKEGQMVTLKEALAHSINKVSAYLIKQYSPQSVIKVARKMGVVSHIDPVPSICVGAADLSLYEMVGAMNTFANKGVYIQPIFVSRIEDKNGNVLRGFVPRQEEAMSAETAWQMLTLMKGVVETGTGIRLRGKYKLMNPIAGKTGTTQNNSDGWFMGLTPDLVTGVWVGAEDRSVHFRSTTLGQGANTALPIWALYMKKLYADPDIKINIGDFEKPLNYHFNFDCGSQQAATKADEENF